MNRSFLPIAALVTAVAFSHSHAATPSDLEKAADYLLEQAGGGLRVARAGDHVTFETASGDILTAERISDAAGVELADTDVSALLDLVSARAAAAGGASCTTTEAASGSACTTQNLCSDLAACSFYGDLAAAQGEKRARYLAEKAQDGRRYDDFDLPTFEARDTEGQAVSSTSLHGKPTLLALLAPHCGHSLRSLSTLKRIDRRYGPKGIEVVGVFVNTSSIASAQSRGAQYELTYPLWTYAGDDLGDALESHLAPTTLLLDAHGKVREKLVGEKTEKELAKRLDAFLSNEEVELGMVR